MGKASHDEMGNMGKKRRLNFNWLILGIHEKEIKVASQSEFYNDKR